MTLYESKSRTWYAPSRPPVLNPSASLGQVLLNVLERTPTKVAQVNGDTGAVLTCDELRRRAIRFARFLTATVGATREDRLALVARNSDNVAPIAFGCFLAGVTLCTLDPAFSREEIEHVLRITQPRAVLADWDALPPVQAAIERLGFRLEYGKFGVLQASEKKLKELPGGKGKDCFSIDTWLQRAEDGADDEDTYVPGYLGDSERLTAAIVLSSGTTGVRKAVRISHAQLIAPYQRISQLDNDDTILCFSTLYWISGMQMLLTGVLNGIRRIITSSSWSAQNAIDLCQRHNVTILFVTPSLAADMHRTLSLTGERLRSLKLFAMGGCMVPVAMRETISREVVVAGRGRCMVGYGTSETGPVAYALVPRNDSVGFLLPGIKAQIVDEQGHLLGPEESGELLVRTVHPFLGYYNDAAATAQALAADGFLRTGDIARFDAEGFLYLVDRKKEIFKYAGHQVSPTELEMVIGELPGVRLVAVVGLPDPAEPFNDLATALIVREDGHGSDTLTEQSVLEHLHGRVQASHKRLRGGVIFVHHLPMTVNGKVNRGQAKQIAFRFRKP